jgi:hypothetical protein
VFSHWISSSVKNIQAHSGLAPYLLAMTIKERDVFFHWISSSVKNIQAHSGLARYLFGNDKKGGKCDIFLTGFHPALKTFKSIRAWHDTFLEMLKKGVNVIFFSLNFIQR